MHFPGALVHVIIRFVDGRFVLDDEARAHYLRLLARALVATDWSLISYALMSSHIHLGLLMGAVELRSWVLSLHVRFAQWINRRLSTDNPKVLGHVFADRPTTKVLPPDRARFLIAYHHRNPLAAGVIDDLIASPWTSHQAYLGLASCEGGLDVSLGLDLACFARSSAGRLAFHEFVSRTDVTLDDVGFTLPEGDSTSPPRKASAASPSDVLRCAAEAMNEPLENVRRGSRCARAVAVRRVAVVSWLELGGSACEMAAVLGISRSAVSRLLSRPHDIAAVHAEAEIVCTIIAAEGGPRVN